LVVFLASAFLAAVFTVGLDADLTVESFPEGLPLLVNGPGMYRADGQTWIAVGSPIQHQPYQLEAFHSPFFELLTLITILFLLFLIIVLKLYSKTLIVLKQLLTFF
jgi:hypothetical protein